LVVFASPSFIPTIPNAWPDGSLVPHCGHEISFPVATVVPPDLAASAGLLISSSAIKGKRIRFTGRGLPLVTYILPDHHKLCPSHKSHPHTGPYARSRTWRWWANTDSYSSGCHANPHAGTEQWFSTRWPDGCTDAAAKNRRRI